MTKQAVCLGILRRNPNALLTDCRKVNPAITRFDLSVARKALGIKHDPNELKSQTLKAGNKEKAQGLVELAAPEAKSYQDERQERGESFWQEQHRQCRKKLDAALKDAVVADRLVDMARSLAPMSYNPAAPAIPKPKAGVKERGEPQSAFLLLSDTHVGQVVTREQTLEFGCYNFEVFKARLKYLERFIIRQVTDNNTLNLTEELVIGMLGDMIHGALGHGSEADQHSTKFAQFYAAGHVIAQFFRNLAPFFPKIRISTTCGNHTRWDSQHKMPTVNRFSNLDQFLYAYIKELIRDIPNIEFTLNAQPFQLIKIQGRTFHLSHGDHLKGGDKALGIPSHSISRQINATAQMLAKQKRDIVYAYCIGHIHRPIEIPTTHGKFMSNGGFPGADGYAVMSNFALIEPSQAFCFVHPEYGIHSRSDVQIWRGDSQGSDYVVPDLGFPIE